MTDTYEGLKAQSDAIKARNRSEIEIERDNLKAEVKMLRGILMDADKIISLCDQGRAGRVHDHMDMRANELGLLNGYGAWMDSIQRMWEARDPVGCFTVGPCLGTVRYLRNRISAALVDPPNPQASAGGEAAPMHDVVGQQPEKSHV